VLQRAQATLNEAEGSGEDDDYSGSCSLCIALHFGLDEISRRVFATPAASGNREVIANFLE
jgi:hypothetical protein